MVFNPLMMYGVQSLVFKTFLKLQVPNYALFLLSGLLPWIFISQALEMCTSLLVTSGPLLKSYPVHPLVYLFAQLVDNAINFLAAFILLLVPVWYFQPGQSLPLLLLPIPLVLLLVSVLGLAWLLATLQVFFRDTRFLVTFAISICFFITPIFYPTAFVPEKFRWMTMINPFHRLIDPFRVVIYNFSFEAFVNSCFAAAIVATASISIAYLFWRKKRNAVYLNI